MVDLPSKSHSARGEADYQRIVDRQVADAIERVESTLLAHATLIAYGVLLIRTAKIRALENPS